jgi:hypothetical protein
MPDKSIHFTLLENGLDFIWSAVENLDRRASKGALKYAVLHLASGIELVLKERLHRQDWTLLFSKPEKADLNAYYTGTFYSVGFDTCLERLADIGVELDDDVMDGLGVIRDKRNRIQHFRIEDSPDAIIPAAAVALGIILDFIRDELADRALTEPEQALLRSIRAKLGDLTAFVGTRLQSIDANLKEAYRILPCPACLQDSLSVDDGVSCLFCGYAGSSDDAAEAYAAHVIGSSRFRFEKDGGVWPVVFCPACDWETCVETGASGHLCYGCGEQFELGTLEGCGRCGRLVREGEAVCSSCQDEITSRDD